MNFKKQHGAVLAFSLVMLLLLTLAGTRMIQQNKQQLQIAGNARLLTQEFANAEGLLAAAKNVINAIPSHKDASGLLVSDPNHQCAPTTDGNRLIQNQMLAGTYSGFTIQAVRCIDSDGAFNQCTSYKAGKIYCDSNSTIECTYDATGIPTNSSTACYADTYTATCLTGNAACTDGTMPTCDKDGNLICTDGSISTCPADLLHEPWCGSPIKSLCRTEVYTTQVISTTATTGATREIISDYAVGCAIIP